MPPIVRIIVYAVKQLRYQASEAILGGVLSWVCFASLGAALFSVFLLRTLSQYKLVNCIIVVFSALGILGVNVAYFELPVFASFRDSGASWGALSAFVSEPPLVALNIGVFLAFTIIGIVNQMFFRKD